MKPETTKPLADIAFPCGGTGTAYRAFVNGALIDIKAPPEGITSRFLRLNVRDGVGHLENFNVNPGKLEYLEGIGATAVHDLSSLIPDQIIRIPKRRRVMREIKEAVATYILASLAVAFLFFLLWLALRAYAKSPVTLDEIAGLLW